jgi:hypothetical protein
MPGAAKGRFQSWRGSISSGEMVNRSETFAVTGKVL